MNVEIKFTISDLGDLNYFFGIQFLLDTGARQIIVS